MMGDGEVKSIKFDQMLINCWPPFWPPFQSNLIICLNFRVPKSIGDCAGCPTLHFYKLSYNISKIWRVFDTKQVN